MTAASVKRISSIIILAMMVFVFVVVPVGNGLVYADGQGTGHPVQPNPPDSTMTSVVINPEPEIPSTYEASLLLSGLSLMIM